MIKENRSSLINRWDKLLEEFVVLFGGRFEKRIWEQHASLGLNSWRAGDPMWRSEREKKDRLKLMRRCKKETGIWPVDPAAISKEDRASIRMFFRFLRRELKEGETSL